MTFPRLVEVCFVVPCRLERIFSKSRDTAQREPRLQHRLVTIDGHVADIVDHGPDLWTDQTFFQDHNYSVIEVDQSDIFGVQGVAIIEIEVGLLVFSVQSGNKAAQIPDSQVKHNTI